MDLLIVGIFWSFSNAIFIIFIAESSRDAAPTLFPIQYHTERFLSHDASTLVQNALNLG